MGLNEQNVCLLEHQSIWCTTDISDSEKFDNRLV